MLHFLVLCLLCAGALADYSEHYSFSQVVGSGTGTAFATPATGRIMAVRVWELPNSHISGFQLQYDYIWAPLAGHKTGNKMEISLFEGEAIIQVSGKYNPSNYIYQLRFSTSRGRSLTAGQPLQISFNHYPTHPDSELRMLSGRFNSRGITSLGAHWGALDSDFPTKPHFPTPSPMDHNSTTTMALN